MQPLTTLYKYMSHSTKTKWKIWFTIFLINKKIFAFVEKIFNLDWRKSITTWPKIDVFYI